MKEFCWIRKIGFPFSISLLLLPFLFLGCENWDLPLEEFPSVITGTSETGTTPTEAILFGEIQDLGESGFVDNHGHVWSLTNDPPPSIEDNNGQSLFGKKGNGVFQSDLNDLTPGATYYYRSYVISQNKVIYGDEIRVFDSGDFNPNFSIDNIVRESAFTVRVYTTISNLPLDLELNSFGLTWDTNEIPEIDNAPFFPQQNLVTSSSAIQFETLINLDQEGIHYIRPFLVVGNQPIYGDAEEYIIGNVWLRGADFIGGRRDNAIAISIGNKGYIGLGDQFVDISNSFIYSDFWEYDPVNDSWTQKADFPGGYRRGALGFSINNKGYIGCGTDGWEDFVDLWEFSPIDNIWIPKADVPGGGRIDGVGFSINQKGYVGLGHTHLLTDFFNDFWEYNPIDNSWMQRASFPGELRYNAASFSTTDKAYVGLGSNSNFQRVKAFYEYDPQINSWTQKADFGGGERNGAFGFSIGDKGYMGGGLNNNFNFQDDLWEYNSEFNSWKQLRSIGENYRRSGGVAFSIDIRGYVGLGYSSSDEREDWWIYVPD